ncbi:MAG: GNAT family N-acetyltransferase [Planctomycetota bacterium]
MRRSTPADAEAIASLVTAAFGADDTHQFEAAWWHWKYGSNPAGFQGLVAQDAEGRIVGHFGGVPLNVRVDNQSLTFAQGCDTCTDPAVRRGLHNPGVFVRLAQAYTSTYGIPGCNAVMFGMPNQRSYRIGSRYADYRILRQQWLLVSRGESSASADTGVEVHDVTSVDDDVTALCEHVRRRYRCMTRRDARFLRWRFLDAPASPYRITLARSSTDGTLRAYAVHRLGRLMGNVVGILVDWLCDPTDLAAARSLQAAVREHYARLGRSEVVFLCPTASPWFRVFQGWGFCVRPSPYMMMALPFAPQLEPRFLRKHWYYTLADFDIF